MRKVAWSKDRPEIVEVEDEVGKTEITLLRNERFGDLALIEEAHRKALANEASDGRRVIVVSRKTRG